jgi:hypothetical protein
VPTEPHPMPGHPHRPSRQEQVTVNVDPQASICPEHCRFPSHEAPDVTAPTEGQLAVPGLGLGKPTLLLIFPPQYAVSTPSNNPTTDPKRTREGRIPQC